MQNKSCIQILNARGEVISKFPPPESHLEFSGAGHGGIRENGGVRFVLLVKPLPTAKERRAEQLIALKLKYGADHTWAEFVGEIEKIFTEEQD